MADLRDEYRAYMRAVKGWSDRTVDERLLMYDRMVRMFGSPAAVVGASRDDVLRFLAEIGGSPSSRNTYRGHVRSLYSYLGFRGMIEKASDPTLEIEPVKARLGLPKPLSPGDAMALMQSAERCGGRTQALVGLMLYTGLRLSEVTNLRWEAIDLPSRRLRVLGKGNKERILPIADALVAILRDWREHSESPWVFPSPIDPRGPIHIQTVRDELSKAARRAGLGHINPHRLRHTFATTLVDNSVDIRRVQVLLGHASLATTQVYTQVSVAHLERDIGTLDFGRKQESPPLKGGAIPA